ncbi:hypothetical protein P0082_05770 [Candidatus Haliotispira prima]|uniref:Uncharacterized protein n=1 Tax=Candidatus Haliotispira prima TaxID=3034016 RepID=A0ABY8MKH5_9SPIO|nr:hypothetical protein P0082_05770 [Candidatus Haliotispira prima]
MKHRQTLLTGKPENSRISNIQYPISNIAHINSILLSKFPPFFLLSFYFLHSSVAGRLCRPGHRLCPHFQIHRQL